MGIDAFEDDTLDLVVGFSHAAFVGVELDMSDAWVLTNGVETGAVGGDGDFLKIVSDVLTLDDDVAAEAYDFLLDLGLETSEDAHGHEHD